MRAGLVPVVFFALSVAWSWPAAISGDVIGRHVDALGTVWFIDAAPRLALSGADALTGWPAGVTYGRLDSFTLWGLSWLLDGLSPVRLHAWVAILGLTVSAWAAEGFAHALGAQRPWSLLAGLGFAFCGLAGTALLEGYVYHLLNPWLPLLGWSWWRALSATGRPIHGLGAGVCFLLTLLTSAYLGLAAAVLVGVMAIGQRIEAPRSPVGPALVAAATVLPGLALYLWAFLTAPGDHGVALSSGGPALQQLGRTLIRMSGPTVDTDLNGVSQSLALPGVLTALVVTAPLVLRRRPGWRGLAAAGLVGLLLSAAPRIDPVGISGVDAVLAPLLRFPDRLAWSWQLAGGVVGAWVLSTIAARFPRPAALILLAAAAEPFLISQIPFRQGTTPAAVPSAYAAHDGPVLDYWPEDVFDAPRWLLRTTNTGCYYQTRHRRPIADHCIFTPGQPSPREVLTAWMTPRLLDGEGEAVAAHLGALGFASLVLHPDPFRPADAARLIEVLSAVDPAPVRSVDGGEHLIAFALPPVSEPTPRQTWIAWQASLQAAH